MQGKADNAGECKASGAAASTIFSATWQVCIHNTVLPDGLADCSWGQGLAAPCCTGMHKHAARSRRVPTVAVGF
jgi:hypothetical protein